MCSVDKNRRDHASYSAEMNKSRVIFGYIVPIATCGTEVHRLEIKHGPSKGTFFWVCSCIGRGSACEHSACVVIGYPIVCDVEHNERHGMGRIALTQEGLDLEQDEYNARLKAKHVNK